MLKEIKLKWFFLLAIIWISIGIYVERQKDGKRKKEVENLTVELTGIVQYVDVPNGYNNFGIVGVNVLSSNQSNIPVKDRAKAQYCIIKNKKAEFYQFAPQLCSIGDTVYINTSTTTFNISKQGGKRIKKGILLNDNDRFWKYILRHTKL
jgi:hypothetical protein